MCFLDDHLFDRDLPVAVAPCTFKGGFEDGFFVGEFTRPRVNGHQAPSAFGQGQIPRKDDIEGDLERSLELGRNVGCPQLAIGPEDKKPSFDLIARLEIGGRFEIEIIVRPVAGRAVERR